MDERIDAAPGAAGGDTQQAFGGGIAEVDGKIGDHEEMVLFGDHAGLVVVFGDGGVIVAQVHLDDLLDMLVEAGQALLDLRRLRPDAAVDDLLLVVGQVHNAGEILSEADRVDDGEVQPSGGCGGQEPEDDVVEGADGLVVAGFSSLEQD